MILALIFIFRRGILRFGAILIGILVGAIYSYAVHIMSTQEIIEAPLIALPRIWPWGLESIQWNLVSAGLVPILIASLMLPTEAIGVYYTVGALDNVTITDERVRKGILGETLGSLVSLLFGSLPTTTYAQNVGAIAVTRVGARRVFTATGILLIILGLIPKIGAIIVSIPGPILGSAFVIIYSMLLLTGISVLADMDWTDKNAVIVAVSLGVALGIQYVPSTVIAQLPLYIRTIMSPLIIGTLMAIVLNLIVNLIPQWVKANKANKEDTA
jgi:Xanthine/uracil permeases